METSKFGCSDLSLVFHSICMLYCMINGLAMLSFHGMDPPWLNISEKLSGKKSTTNDDDEVKSIFGKAPKQKRNSADYSDEDDESARPSVLRQIVQSVLQRMEAIFGVDE